MIYPDGMPTDKLLSSRWSGNTRDPAERSKNRPFPPLHATCFGLAPLMVVTTEMQNPVDQQHDDFLIKRSLSVPGLAHRRRNGDHDIAQQAGRQASGVRQPGLPCGERQNVRRAIFVPKLPIEAAHATITDKRETQFRRRFPNVAKHGLRQSPDTRFVELHGSNLGLEQNRHLVRLARGIFGARRGGL
jgi:hypothetical protein